MKIGRCRWVGVRRAPVAALLLMGSLSGSAWAQTFGDLFPPVARGKGPTVSEKPAEQEAGVQEETEQEKLIDAVVLRQVKFDTDWNPDPTAMPQLVYQARKALRMRVQMVEEPVELSDPEIFKCSLLYMTAHNSFRLTKAERENLKKYLTQGGVLIGDDCTAGGGGWLPSLYAEVARMFPGESFIDVAPEHPRFGKMFKVSYQFKDTIKVIRRLHNQALILDGRLAIYLILDDYGCMWEVRSPPSAADPLGTSNHGFSPEERKACFEFCFNLLLYLLSH